MRTRIIILILILFPAGKIVLAQAPELSPESTISLLTCGPGPEVYTYFGHSALRVTDPVLNLDRVYNYGTFDFNVPDFYGQFIDGKLWYMLSVVRFRGFIPDYMAEKRFIKELTLNLSKEDRQELFNLLEINYLPENRHYWYDFFKDNCSSRIRDIVVKATGGKFLWPPEPAEHLSYRQLIMPYISLNTWARTGILLMLTAGADEKASQEGYMFLPDQMHRLFAQARQADGTPLCQPEKVLFMPEYPRQKGTGLLHPITILSLLLVISLAIFFYKKTPEKLAKSFFSLIFAMAGLLGMVFTYMWFFSGHMVCHGNLNIAWAFPLTLFLAATIWITKATPLNRIYSKVMIILTLLFLITFPLWKQRVPFEAILFSLTLLTGFFRFSGFNVFGNRKTKDQTN
jgi:hypothetical protein